MNIITLNKHRGKLKDWCFKKPKISYCNRYMSLKMEKYNTFLLFFLLAFLGCKSTDEKTSVKQTEYFYVQYNLDCCTELKLDTVNVDYLVDIKDSIYKLNYIYFNDSTADTITYKYKLSEEFEPAYLYNGRKRKFDEYMYVANESYIIKGKYFNVYKYAHNPNVIDGCINHFWTPKIGVFISRSWTWKNFRKLQTDNDSINEYIDLLTELIYQDIGFYGGCDEELDLIPKSDAEKFYSEKINEILDLVND